MKQVYRYFFMSLFLPAFAFASIDQDCRVKIVKSNLESDLHQSLENKLVQNGFQFSQDATRGIEISANHFSNPTECQAGYEHRGCLIKVVGFEQAPAGILGNASVCVNSSQATWQPDDIACKAALSKLALPSCFNNLKNSFEPDSSYSSNFTLSTFRDSAETDVLDFADSGQMEFENFKLSVSGIDPQTGSMRPYKLGIGINLLQQPIKIWNQKPLESLTDTVVLTVVKKTTNNSKDVRIKLSNAIDFKNIIPVNEIENGKASVNDLNVKIAVVALSEDFDQLAVQVEITGSGWMGFDKKYYSYDYIGILDISGPNAVWRKGEEDHSSTPRQSRYFPQKLKLGNGDYLGTMFTLVSTQHIRYNDKSPVIRVELSKYDKASMRFVSYQSTAEFQVLLAPKGEGDSGQSEWKPFGSKFIHQCYRYYSSNSDCFFINTSNGRVFSLSEIAPPKKDSILAAYHTFIANENYLYTLSTFVKRTGGGFIQLKKFRTSDLETKGGLATPVAEFLNLSAVPIFEEGLFGDDAFLSKYHGQHALVKLDDSGEIKIKTLAPLNTTDVYGETALNLLGIDKNQLLFQAWAARLSDSTKLLSLNIKDGSVKILRTILPGYNERLDSCNFRVNLEKHVLEAPSCSYTSVAY